MEKLEIVVRTSLLENKQSLNTHGVSLKTETRMRKLASVGDIGGPSSLANDV